MIRHRGMGMVRWLLPLVLLLVAPAALAQTSAPDTTDAGADGTPALTGLQAAGQEQAEDTATVEPDTVVVLEAGPLFQSLGNKPKAGVRADVSKYEYYGELDTVLKMRAGSQATNSFSWSRQTYRRFAKTIEKRSNHLVYGAGRQLPFTLTADGLYDWSADLTDNNAIRREALGGTMTLRRNEIWTGALVHRIRGTAGVQDENSENRDIGASINEGRATAHLQTGWLIRDGVTLAGRLYGSGASGTRGLRDEESASSAYGDTLGVGAYYDQTWLVGRAVVTRSAFDSRYLDWLRGQTGAVDTLGVSIDEQIQDEKEIREKMALLWENQLQLGRLGLLCDVAREIDETSYAKSAQGRRKNHDESLDLQATLAAGARDSFVVGYGYSMKWDDQFYHDGSRRGRQSTKRFAADFKWYHTLFRATHLLLGMGQDLSQQIPDEVRTAGQNRDQLVTDLNLQLRRSWTDFRTTLIVGWNQRQDVAINSNQSIQNNIQDSYEVAPRYTWTLNEWLRLSQQYKLWIQYTDWEHPDDRRTDNYNKRGNLNTSLTFEPTERLEVTIEHDYNRRFNATESGRNAEDNPIYVKNQIQTVSNIDLGLKFEAAKGVVFEAATYRKKDIKEFPQNESLNENFSGELWIGARVNKRWGRTNPLELSAMVKKYNAFGPSVQATSRDYWVADTWLKWSF